MTFEEWAKNCYTKEYPSNTDEMPDKEYKDGLKDRVNKRIVMVLQLYEYSDDKYKRVQIPKDRKSYFSRYDYETAGNQHWENVNRTIKNIYGKYHRYDRSQERIKEKLKNSSQYEMEGLKKKLDNENNRKEKEKGLKERYEKQLERLWDGVMIELFEEVSEMEEDFYQFLLTVIPTGTNHDSIFQCLKRDEWWVLSIADRRKILHYLTLLMKSDKWFFVRSIYYNVAEKLIRPHEYKMLKAMKEMMAVMDWDECLPSTQEITVCIPERKTAKTVAEKEEVVFQYNKEVEKKFGSQIIKLADEIMKIVSDMDDYINRYGQFPNIEEQLQEFGKMSQLGEELR